jgi:hypothetical protein
MGAVRSGGEAEQAVQRVTICELPTPTVRAFSARYERERDYTKQKRKANSDC